MREDSAISVVPSSGLGEIKSHPDPPLKRWAIFQSALMLSNAPNQLVDQTRRGEAGADRYATRTAKRFQRGAEPPCVSLATAKRRFSAASASSGRKRSASLNWAIASEVCPSRI